MTRSIETAAPGTSAASAPKDDQRIIDGLKDVVAGDFTVRPYSMPKASAPNLDAGVVGDLVEALTRVAHGRYRCYLDAQNGSRAALAKYATQQGGGENQVGARLAAPLDEREGEG